MTTKTRQPETSIQKIILLDPEACRLAPEIARIQKAMPTSYEDKNALFDSIARKGVTDPVKGYFKAGTFYILSGWTRREGALRAKRKLPATEVDVAPDSRAFFAAEENTQRRHMTVEDKRGLTRAMLVEYHMQGNVPIAQVCGVSPKIVKEIRLQLIQQKKIPESNYIMSAHGSLRSAQNSASTETKIKRLTHRIAVSEERIVALQHSIKQDYKSLNVLRKELRS